MSTWEGKFRAVQNEGYSLFVRKNKDYGDAFTQYGVVGCLVRIGDKLSRLQSVTRNSVSYVEDERLEDTLLDLMNYAAIAVALKRTDSSAPVTTNVETDAHVCR